MYKALKDLLLENDGNYWQLCVLSNIYATVKNARCVGNALAVGYMTHYLYGLLFYSK